MEMERDRQWRETGDGERARDRVENNLRGDGERARDRVENNLRGDGERTAMERDRRWRESGNGERDRERESERQSRAQLGHKIHIYCSLTAGDRPLIPCHTYFTLSYSHDADCRSL